MKANIQFTVSCDLCPANDVNNNFLLWPSGMRFEAAQSDAKVWFERAGWQQQPSGKWICRKHTRQVKEAA